MNKKIERFPAGALLAAGLLFMQLLGATGAAVAATPSDTATSPGPAKHDGMAMGLTADGHPYLGSPKAPVTIEEFSDYLCPYCESHYRRTLPGLLEKYVRSGQVRYVFRDFPIASLHPPAPAAAAAALCVAEQGAERFWSMHDRLFESRARWAAAATPDSLLHEFAAAAGADMPRYDECMQSGRTKEKVAASVAEGQKLGFNGTPSFRFTRAAGGDAHTFSGAYPIEKFSDWIDAMLAGRDPPAPAATPQEPKMGKLPYWASPEGLAPDPARPGFTMAGDAYKGNPKAALVIAEFSDFQCPSCQRHALETEPVLDAKFIATGKVYWVFKNLPLAMHANAPAAAAAAECAGAQGRFWEMAHLLFASSDKWSNGNPDSAIVALATQAGVSPAAFRACYDGRPAMERILRDLYDSKDAATTTPTFILIQDGRGRVLTGAQKTENFVKIIEQALAPAAAPAQK